MDDTTTTASPDIEIVVVPARADRIVDHWFTDTFHNIGIDPQLYQRFTAAREDLKRRLKEE